MDGVKTLAKSKAMLAKSVGILPRVVSSSLSLGVVASFTCSLPAQSPRVDVAIEPRMTSSPKVVPKGSTQQPMQRSESVEPERIQKAQTQVFNFLPPQRPIGQINIDLRSKPKNGNDAVPENLAQQILGPTPAVQASRSDEMLGDIAFPVRRNHGEIIAHQPLYFEEVNLERYGRTHGPLQPALSGVRFLATIPSLPYAMTVHHPNQTYVTRWPFGAGWGAPKVRELQPLQLKPSLVQAGAITGLIFVVP
jgi:hypothetical protein